MSWFRSITKSAETISSTDVVDAFVLMRLLQLSSSVSPHIQQFLQSEIRNSAQRLQRKFVSVFTDLMRRQIKKYLEERPKSDKRVVGGTEEWLSTYPLVSLVELVFMIDTASQRSIRRQQQEGKTRNEAWAKIGYKVAELAEARDPKSILESLTFQGGLFSLVHNTGSLVLGKLPGNLLQSLNLCNQARDIQQLLPYASDDVREIARDINR